MLLRIYSLLSEIKKQNDTLALIASRNVPNVLMIGTFLRRPTICYIKAMGVLIRNELNKLLKIYLKTLRNLFWHSVYLGSLSEFPT